MEWLFTRTPLRWLDLRTPGAAWCVLVLVGLTAAMWFYILAH